MTSAILYETLCELVHIENAWTVFSQIRQKCDVHQDLPQIVASVSDITGIPIYRINEAWKRVRHSFEAYPFRYEILEEDSALFPDAEGIHFLYAYGDLSLLERAPVTVVGMRGPGQEARSDAVAVLKDLSDLDCPVMGTLDTGLDAYVMLYALNTGMAQIAVLASPLHQCMPESQKELMEGIANSGRSLLLSPFAPSSRAQKWFTVPRNRLLVALTGTMVILEEKDGGPLWRLAGQVLDRGGRLVIAQNCVSNPAYGYARDYAARPSVSLFRRRGDLKLLSGGTVRRRKNAGTDVQLELFT